LTTTVPPLTPKQLSRQAYYQANKEKHSSYQKLRYLIKKQELLEYQRKYRLENKNKINLRAQLKKEATQDAAIQYLGGKCSRCLNSYPRIVYDFHHKNPETKDFILSEHWGDSREKIWAELDKCILLCANCHRLEHEG
jgi:NAD-dependent dihydropyrimidine dehydrogenase PreA subunit